MQEMEIDYHRGGFGNDLKHQLAAVQVQDVDNRRGSDKEIQSPFLQEHDVD